MRTARREVAGLTDIIDQITMVRTILEKHHPVEFCQWSVQFELNYCACVCGQWAGQGAWFQHHRAEEIVKAIEESSGESE